MDLGDYWEENKRFVMGVAGGALLFLIAYLVVSSTYAGDIRAERSELARHQRDLAEPMFTASDLAEAREQNEALAAALAELVAAGDFRPRPEFVVDPAAGAANAQYLLTLSRVREELMTRANRGNLVVDSELGMPSLSPTREAEIERYLEALDVVESVVDLALAARARRVERILVKLDPGLNSRDGLGRIERTRVRFTITGNSLAVTRVLAWTQRPLTEDGRVLHVDEVEVLPSRSKVDEVRLDLTIIVPRIDVDLGVEGEEEAA